MNGVMVVNKPKGITSHDVVRRVRQIAQQRDVGHLGTLDPMATGVLPLVLGRMTRLAQFYDDAEKAYEGTIAFGFATDTYDAEGKMVGQLGTVNFGAAELEGAMAAFRGEIQQIPPPFSAKKVAGVPAYRLARKNESVPLKAIRVTVSRFEMKSFRVTQPLSEPARPSEYPQDHLACAEVEFVADVSSGTYIRSLAHDLGQQLRVGAHLKTLCRIRSSDFDLSHTFSLDEIEKAAAENDLARCVVPSRALLPGMPNVTATEDQLSKVRHGNAVNLAEFSQAEFIKVFAAQGDLVAIARRVAGSLFQPKVVLV